MVSSADGAMLNDMLGTTLGTVDGTSARMTGITAFGETSDNAALFTGKPMVDGLGYAFLFRNYQSQTGKWLSADPIGYPDGWNNLAYCGNSLINHFDYLGCEDIEIQALWTACYAVACARAVLELSPTYNFTGFKHWLDGKGETVTLDWECFDYGSEYANMVCQNLYHFNIHSALQISQKLQVNGTYSFANPNIV